MATETAYTGRELTDLLRGMTPGRVRSALKTAYRRVAKRAVETARLSLSSSGLHVAGDLPRGIRSHIYSRGGGFLVTVKARGSRSGQERGMHENRRGLKKPVLMWAEDGTTRRSAGGHAAGGWRQYVRTRATGLMPRRVGGYNRGSMPAYHFLAGAESRMAAQAERDLMPEVERAVAKTAAKYGFS